MQNPLVQLVENACRVFRSEMEHGEHHNLHVALHDCDTNGPASAVHTAHALTLAQRRHAAVEGAPDPITGEDPGKALAAAHGAAGDPRGGDA